MLMDQNEDHIIISFSDFNYSPQLISDKLKIEPTTYGIKDEEHLLGNNNTVKKVWKSNVWRFEWNLKTNAFIGDITQNFMEDIIIPRKEAIKELSLTSEVEFSIVQYYYDGYNPGTFIKKEQIKILSEINCSINIDIYCLNEKKL
jgi:Domain of unknown function (DUF4279)